MESNKAVEIELTEVELLLLWGFAPRLASRFHTQTTVDSVKQKIDAALHRRTSEDPTKLSLGYDELMCMWGFIPQPETTSYPNEAKSLALKVMYQITRFRTGKV